MPFSSNTFDSILCEQIARINPNIVLDVGSGAGKYGKLIKATCPSSKIVAIEPTHEYVQKYNLNSLYDEVCEMELDKYCNDKTSNRYDAVIFGDVLEHFFHSKAIDYIDYFLYRSEWVFAIFPSRMPQDDWGGNSYEIHKSNITLSDLASKFDVQFYKKVFGWFHWNNPEMTHCWYNYVVMRGYVVKRNVSL
jgi:hypothetical protein